MGKEKIWNLTLPQLNYLLKQCNEHIDFTVKVSTMGFPSFLGGGTASSSDVTETREDGEYEGDYKVATAEDMGWLANVLGA
ncbi:hypothetical protein IAQ67_28320 (plasmid) [Paenibacillus peoriae]|uniref:Uncharacterized protein n=1 Tax=Paenibacillus peoriae TaxID=59893 RepID=A0A7H0YHE4_9BACL|nr:hypothetical protein [Paenibacillus peoriae]QNR70502.1 hypothetical protein IAQ67_28320 [Paenibacillus peoriae]